MVLSKGSKRPMAASGWALACPSTAPAGKALLARLPAAEQQALITELRLTRHTAKTITAKGALRAELERIVTEGGVAVEDEELSPGRRAIATAVMDPGGGDR